MPSGSKIMFNDIHPQDMTEDEWLEDLEALFSMMRDNNPYMKLKERQLGYRWLDFYDNYCNRIRNGKAALDYLKVMFDAAQALQNGHAEIITPGSLDGFYEVEYYRATSPFSEVFSESLKNYYRYWEPIIDEFLEQRNSLNFDAQSWYNNGDYLIEAGYGDWKEKYGIHSRIIAVDGIPIHDAVKDCFEKGILNRDFKRELFYLWRIQPKHFRPDAEFTIETESGERKNVVFETGYDFKYSFTTVYPVLRLETEVWPEKQAGYVRIGDFEESLADDDNKVLMKFYRQIEDYRLLIIDVRGNQGGCYEPWMRNVIAPLAKTKLTSKMYLAFRSGEYVEMFRKVAEIGDVVPKDSFEKLPPEVMSDDFTIYDYTQTVEPSGDIDFRGKIVVLIDAITFSATDAFALFCKETGLAKLYGKPSGGDGISDSPIYYVLPNSKLLVRFTPGMGIDYTGAANEEVCVHPDVYHESSFGNMTELVDFVLDQEL
ncbi:MAG: S41 family peptidase [Candidatus Thorarchaeota archaeon]